MSTPDEELRAAERAHAADPTAETLAILVGVRHRVGWKSPDQIKREQFQALCDASPHVTKEIAVLAGEIGGVSFWAGDHLTDSVEEYRVNGKCKTWKTEPEKFQLPVKQGWNNYGYITSRYGAYFKTKPPAGRVNVTVRRVELRGDYVKANVLGAQRGDYRGAGQKLWAVDADSPPGSGCPSQVLKIGDHFYFELRSQDRDSVRAEIKALYRRLGLAVNFRR